MADESKLNSDSNVENEKEASRLFPDDVPGGEEVQARALSFVNGAVTALQGLTRRSDRGQGSTISGVACSGADILHTSYTSKHQSRSSHGNCFATSQKMGLYSRRCIPHEVGSALKSIIQRLEQKLSTLCTTPLQHHQQAALLPVLHQKPTRLPRVPNPPLSRTKRQIQQFLR